MPSTIATVQVKLIATYRDYLPAGSRGGICRCEIGGHATAGEVLAALGVPLEGSVILVNGSAPDPDEPLRDGDVVCAFPAVGGG